MGATLVSQGIQDVLRRRPTRSGSHRCDLFLFMTLSPLSNKPFFAMGRDEEDLVFFSVVKSVRAGNVRYPLSLETFVLRVGHMNSGNFVALFNGPASSRTVNKFEIRHGVIVVVDRAMICSGKHGTVRSTKPQRWTWT